MTNLSEVKCIERRLMRRARLVALQNLKRGWGPERGVAEAMFRLNRYAKVAPMALKDAIYDMKSQIVRIWYEMGLCERVEKHDQQLICWDCGGAGCWSCDDTGVYRTITLYCFYFSISEQRFVWHQPARYVDFPVVVAENDGRAYEERDRGVSETLETEMVRQMFIMVREYLIEHGVKLPRAFV